MCTDAYVFPTWVPILQVRKLRPGRCISFLRGVSHYTPAHLASGLPRAGPCPKHFTHLNSSVSHNSPMDMVPILQMGKLRPREVGSRPGRQPPEAPQPSGPCDAPPRRLTWVVHTCLDDIIHSKTRWRLLVPQLLVDLRGQCLGHVVVVLAEVWVFLLSLEVQLVLVVGVTKRHGGGVGACWAGAEGKISSHPVETSQRTEPVSGVRQA